MINDAINAQIPACCIICPIFSFINFMAYQYLFIYLIFPTTDAQIAVMIISGII